MGLSEAELIGAYREAGIDLAELHDEVDMDEASLQQGITDALTIAGWRWTHIRNSHGVTMGDSGLPDIIAAHPTLDRPLLMWELKGERGQVSYEQLAWLNAMRRPGVDARIIRPADYDTALRFIVFGPELTEAYPGG